MMTARQKSKLKSQRSNVYFYYLPYAFCLLTCGWIGCAAHRPVVKPPLDPSKIRRISVIPFEGPGGSAASDEFVRMLLGTGREVTDARHPGDAILKGTVTEYKSNNQLTVFLGNTPLMTPGNQAAVVDNPVVSRSGSQLTPEGPSQSVRHTEVVSLVASVGIRAHLIDSSTKIEVWTGDYSYEGLDLPTALHALADMMTRSMLK